MNYTKRTMTTNPNRTVTKWDMSDYERAYVIEDNSNPNYRKTVFLRGDGKPIIQEMTATKKILSQKIGNEIVILRETESR